MTLSDGLDAKSKSMISNNEALLKLVFQVPQNINEKWTSPIKKESIIIQQLAIHVKGEVKIRLGLDDHINKKSPHKK